MLAAVAAADVLLATCSAPLQVAAADSLGMGACMDCWSLNARADTDSSYQMLSLCGWTVVHVALCVSVFVTGKLESNVYQS